MLGKQNNRYLEWTKKNNVKNINNFYFKHKLISLIFDEITYQNNIIAENYLSLYKIAVRVNNRYHSKIFNISTEPEEQQTDGFNNDIAEIEKVLTNIKQLKDDLGKKVNEEINKLINNYEDSYKKLENLSKLSDEFTNEINNNIKLSFHSNVLNENKKQNDFYNGLFGNWNFFEDISALNYYALYEFFETRENLNSNLQNKIISEFSKIISLLTSVKSKLEEKKDSDIFLDYLKKEKRSIKHKLEDDLLIQIIKLLPFDNPAPLIKSYAEKVKTLIDNLPEKQTITNLNELNYKSNNGIYTFSTREIIRNNIYNGVFSNLLKLSETARVKIKKIGLEVMELGQISDYNFETTISLMANSVEQDESLENNTIYKTAVAGIDRVIHRCKDISNRLSEISNSTFEECYISVTQFTENLYKLNSSDELIRLKNKLSREKAKEEVNRKIKSFGNNIKNFFPQVISKIKNIYTNTKNSFFKISERVGLTSVPKEVSEEILDYIIETEKQINSLPFIYQRLFKNTPVNDRRFFVGREKELEKINKAYNYWMSGKFAPLVVVSEKGAGASSLTNMAQKEFEKSLHVTHIRLSNTIYKQKDFLKLLSKELNLKEARTFDNLIEQINEQPGKRIVIIENIEDLFLRVVNGFNVIKIFAQLISLTNNKIFWIATCNKYAWNYLNKVINLEDYFAFIIRFNRFSNEDIKEIIMTRHNLSGYKLKFIPSKNDLDDKQYLKLDEQQKQEYLKNNFFNELNRISQSNVALAQLFWLRSITALTDNEIEISSLHNIDFSFLKNLNRQKVFSLAAILIHDGLTVEEHAMVFDFSNEKSRLFLSAMLDDGELRKTGENYRVNFLLYVHIIKLLKDQNILH